LGEGGSPVRDHAAARAPSPRSSPPPGEGEGDHSDRSLAGPAETILPLRPIGLLRTPFRTLAECPRNGHQRQPPPPCEAHIFPEFGPGLGSLDGFSHLLLLYWLDQAGESSLIVTPPFDPAPRGVFATRAPRRPNPIGLSVAAFDGFADPLILRLRYLDCLDGTKLLDIKPYLPSTDSVPEARMGWLAPHRTR
jgi:tRNA-Thr(GGU) m(6)t(6)A37 methyltransferase TsaA